MDDVATGTSGASFNSCSTKRGKPRCVVCSCYALFHIYLKYMLLTWLFIRKANFERIKKILERENFTFTDEDIHNLLKGNRKGLRYGNAVLVRRENGNENRRFFKVVLDGTWRTYKLFRRQVEITRALSSDDQYTLPKLKVEAYSFRPPVPYAVFETREDGDGFGFMHDQTKYYERFTDKDITNLARLIYSFHLSGFNLDRRVFKYTRKISSNPKGYRVEINKNLDKKVLHKYADSSHTETSIDTLLQKYLDIHDIRSKIMKIFDENWSYVESSKVKGKRYLVHADMALDNIYQHQDGSLEPLDFEWVGNSDNPVIPLMYDYGNLRAIAWSSPEFQAKLDRAVLDEGIGRYRDEKMVKAAVNLGILRSGVIMCRFHMDYTNTVKKDRRTEEEYFEMFPKTLASLERLLKT